jgi:hypothetical protein
MKTARPLRTNNPPANVSTTAIAKNRSGSSDLYTLRADRPLPPDQSQPRRIPLTTQANTTDPPPIAASDQKNKNNRGGFPLDTFWPVH